jgi:hypothetical protein
MARRGSETSADIPRLNNTSSPYSIVSFRSIVEFVVTQSYGEVPLQKGRRDARQVFALVLLLVCRIRGIVEELQPCANSVRGLAIFPEGDAPSSPGLLYSATLGRRRRRVAQPHRGCGQASRAPNRISLSQIVIEVVALMVKNWRNPLGLRLDAGMITPKVAGTAT